MGINAFGTDNFLRGAIRTRLLQLRRDDQLIDSEGVEELSTSELQAACQSRGIRTGGVSPARLREEFSTWIDLHLHNRVSGVLLILGRAFYFDRKPTDVEDGKSGIIMSLESVLSGLPDNLVGLIWHLLSSYSFLAISSMKPNSKLMRRLPTSRNWRYFNNRKNSSRTKRNKNKRKRMPAAPRRKKNLVWLNLFYPIPR